MKEQVKNDTNIYRTGSTNPPKSYRGVISVLLALVVVLGGIVTALGLLNVRLFQLLMNQENANAVTFSRNAQKAAVAMAQEEGLYLTALGLTGQDMDGVVGSFLDLPDGVYVAAVTENGPGYRAQLKTGDVITALNEEPVCCGAELQQLLAQKRTGQRALVKVYRDGSYLRFLVVLD